MFFYNDFSHYKADNILAETSKPAHSGPELCTQMPKSILADKLASEVVLDKIILLATERPAWASAGEPARSLRMKF
jgi:hypothetical protein